MTAAERALQLATSLALAGVGVAAIVMGLEFPPAARIIPAIIGGAMAVLAVAQTIAIWNTPPGQEEAPDAEGDTTGLTLLTNPVLARRSIGIIIATALVLPAIPFVGYAVATSAYIVACLIWFARMPAWAALAVGLVNLVAIWIFFEAVVGTPAFGGVLFSLF